MCLLKDNIFPRIAWKPITVYKYMILCRDGSLISPFVYRKSYKTGETMKSTKSPLLGISKKIIGSEGVHSINDSEGYLYNDFRRTPYDTLCLVMCEIPRWSLYFTECRFTFEHFASGRLKLLKILSAYPAPMKREQEPDKKQRNIKKIKHGQKRRKNV